MKNISTFRIIKISLTLLFLLCIGIVIYQSSEPIEVDLLWWHGKISLVVLLLFMGIGSAIITFMWTLRSMRSKNKSKN